MQSFQSDKTCDGERMHIENIPILTHLSKSLFSGTKQTDELSKKVKWSRYRPGVAQRVGRVIALLFHDRGTRRRWPVSSTPRSHFTPPGKTRYPLYRRLGGPQGRSGRAEKSRPHRLARSQLLYRLSYPAHNELSILVNTHSQTGVCCWKHNAGMVI